MMRLSTALTRQAPRLALALALTLLACAPGRDFAGSPAAFGLAGVGGSTGSSGSPPQGTSAAPVTCTTTAPANAPTVQVNVAQGPGGSSQPVVLDRRFYSMNIADWMPQDYGPPVDPTVSAFLKALHPGLLRWPAGHTSQHYIFTRSGTLSSNANSTLPLTPAMVDSFVGLCQAVGAQPYLAVNLKTGTAAQAADLVTYVNNEQHYGVTWWQMGNEPDNLDGLTLDANDYAQHYAQYAPAMRSVDANIKLVGAELLTGAHVIGCNGQTNWLAPILAQNGSMMDAIAWHYYPMDSSSTDPNSSASASAAHLLNENANDWWPSGMDFPSRMFPALEASRNAMAPGAELWVDEFAEDSGPAAGAGLSDTQTGAVWAADELGRFAEQGVRGMFHFLFHSVAAHKYALLDENSSPRPEYYSYWLYAQLFGDHVVNTVASDAQTVAAHAALLAADGSLRLMLVNKTAQAQTVQVTLSGFSPAAASQWVLTDTAGGPQINGSSLTAQSVAQDANAVQPASAAACTNPTVTLPAMSATLIRFAVH